MLFRVYRKIFLPVIQPWGSHEDIQCEQCNTNYQNCYIGSNFGAFY